MRLDETAWWGASWLVFLTEQYNNHIREDKTGGGGMRHAWKRLEESCKMLARKSRRKGSLRRPRRRWEDNIRIDLTEICWESGNWIRLAQDRVHRIACVNIAMNLRFHKRWGISCLGDERLLVAQEGLCSIALISYIPLNSRHKYIYCSSMKYWADIRTAFQNSEGIMTRLGHL
jgi:hypothetical protein